MVLRGKEGRVEEADIDGYFVVNNTVLTGKNHNQERIDYVPCSETDPEIYRIRGFRPAHTKKQE